MEGQKPNGLEQILSRMGNDIIGLVALSKNIANDYQELLDYIMRQQLAKGRSLKKEPMGMRDRVILQVKDKEGNIKQEYDSGWSRNGLTNAGFAEVAGLILADVGGTAFDYIAIGTGTTAFDATQTALVSETARKVATGSRETTSVTNDTAVLTAQFSSSDGLTGASAITESGVFNATTGGTMLCRQTFSALNINWDSGDTLTVTWKIQAKQAT